MIVLFLYGNPYTWKDSLNIKTGSDSASVSHTALCWCILPHLNMDKITTHLNLIFMISTRIQYFTFYWIYWVTFCWITILWLSVGIHFGRNISCSENSLVPPRQQAVTWTNVDTFLWWNMEYLGYNDVRVPVLVTNRATTMWVILASLTDKTVQGYIKSLRLRQNGHQFLDNIFKCIFLNENILILIKISLKFMLKHPINNIPALVQIMAWHWPGDKPLSVPMMVSLLTHICVTWPQWVKL